MKLTNAWAFGLMCCSLVIMEIFSSCFKFSRYLFLACSYSCDFFFLGGSHYSIVFRRNTHTLHRRVKIRALH